jgi:large subunit ribosomal protein L2
MYGRVSNRFFKYTRYGSAKASIKKKKKIISVRGVAMNPVDHPNGGRSNTKQPLKNPWGKIAKKGK